MFAKCFTFLALMSFLLLPPEGISAGPGACIQLGMSSAATNKCLSLQKEFELESPLIASCKNFSTTDSGKLDCVRSGSSVEAVRFCIRMHFRSPEAGLSCLHYTNDMDIAEACARLFSKEKELIDCLKSGRDVSWLQSCGQADPSSRMNCLQTGEISSARGLASETKPEPSY